MVTIAVDRARLDTAAPPGTGDGLSPPRPWLKLAVSGGLVCTADSGEKERFPFG